MRSTQTAQSRGWRLSCLSFFSFIYSVAFHIWCFCSTLRCNWITWTCRNSWPRRQTWSERGEGGPRYQWESRYNATQTCNSLVSYSGLTLCDSFVLTDLFLILGTPGIAGLKGEKGNSGVTGKGESNRFGVNNAHHADTGKGSATANRFVGSCSWSPNASQDAMVGLGL